MTGGDGYLSVSDRAIRIGLGTAGTLDQVTIRWPDGESAAVRGLAPGRYRWVEGRSPEPDRR